MDPLLLVWPFGGLKLIVGQYNIISLVLIFYLVIYSNIPHLAIVPSSREEISHANLFLEIWVSLHHHH